MTNAGALLARPTAARPGPGADGRGAPARARRLDRTARGGLARGRLPLEPPRNRDGARDDAAVRSGRRRAQDRLERDGAHGRAACPRRSRRARARDLARARHVHLDAVRDGRSAQGRRRRGRRGRDRPSRDAARESAGRRDLRRRGVARDPTDAGPRRPRRAAAALRGEPAATGRGRRTLGAALRETGALARQRSLVVVVSDFRGERGVATCRCSSSRGTTTSSPSRSAIRASRSSRTSGSSTSSIPETGRQLRVDTRSRRLRERFAVAAAAERAEVARSFTSVGVRHVVLTTSGDWLRPLVTFLRRSRA